MTAEGIMTLILVLATSIYAVTQTPDILYLDCTKAKFKLGFSLLFVCIVLSTFL